MKQINRFYTLILLALLCACGQAPNPNGDCGSTSSSPCTDPSNYRMPQFETSWELDRGIYEKAVNRYEQVRTSLTNSRYVTIVDFNQNSSKKRLYIFDLASNTVERHLTTHGRGSDPDNDGFATLFSNDSGSEKSSLGFYLTLATYTGSDGYSLRLRGTDSTNSNAEARAIVMHPAPYVDESANHAGRSWGCPALDPKYSQSIIDRLKNGSLLLLDK